MKLGKRKEKKHTISTTWLIKVSSMSVHSYSHTAVNTELQSDHRTAERVLDNVRVGRRKTLKALNSFHTSFMYAQHSARHRCTRLQTCSQITPVRHPPPYQHMPVGQKFSLQVGHWQPLSRDHLADSKHRTWISDLIFAVHVSLNVTGQQSAHKPLSRV